MFPIVVSASRVQQFYCEQNRALHDLKALLRHLVHRVGIRVMEFTHGVKSPPHATILSIDYIHRRYTDRDKRNVVVNDIRIAMEKEPAVT